MDKSELKHFLVILVMSPAMYVKQSKPLLCRMEDAVFSYTKISDESIKLKNKSHKATNEIITMMKYFSCKRNNDLMKII